MWKTKIKNEKNKVELEPNSFNDRYMKLSKAIKNWQCAFLSIFILFIISLGGIIKIGAKSHFVPYIVTVDNNGEIQNLVKPLEEEYEVTSLQEKSYLRKFLIDIRTISLDPVFFGKRYKEALRYTSSSTESKLKDMYVEDDISKKIKEKVTRTIEINSIVKVTGIDRTYKVTWNEKMFQEGGKVGETKYEGIFSLKIVKPRTEKDLLINPLGITIEDININKYF